MKTKKIGNRLPIKAVFAAIIFGLNTIVWAGNVYEVIVVPKGDEKDLGRGDVNRDGVVDYKDRARLEKLVQGTAVPTYGDVLRGDRNLNGRLDWGDAYGTRTWVNNFTYLPGDANGDGIVNQSDLMPVYAFMQSNSTYTGRFIPYNADCNRDGVIDYRDYRGIYYQAYNLATGTNTITNMVVRCDQVER